MHDLRILELSKMEVPRDVQYPYVLKQDKLHVYYELITVLILEVLKFESKLQQITDKIISFLTLLQWQLLALGLILSLTFQHIINLYWKSL